jgi:purine-binding chemotaxis protein CheW
MSATGALSGAAERLLTFEVAGGLFALPIEGVLEVVDMGRVTCIPTMPTEVGGVVNYHGDALPLLRSPSILDVDGAAVAEPSSFLVITDRGSDAARLGVPVDRVLGLVDGSAARSGSGEVVAERRSIDGRVASVLDPKQLVDKARNVIENSFGTAAAPANS